MRNKPGPSGIARCRGAALLLLLVFLVLGSSYALLAGTSPPTGARQTERALAHAREALISWSSAQGVGGGSARPGELPCPDTSNTGTAASSCTSTRIGRLPWKTLGIPQLLDEQGETLWYVVDDAFRRTSTSPINSDTRASLQAYAKNGSTRLTAEGDEAVAIVFAPGRPIGNQRRNTSTEQLSASNYLETALGRNNASNTGPFIDGPITGTDSTLLLNDRLMVLNVRALMAPVEKRVAGEALKLLAKYRDDNGSYPYPALYSHAGCLDVGSTAYMSDCPSDATVCRGRFPDTAQLSAYGLPNWQTIPAWFSRNLWGQTLYYAVGSSRLKTPSPSVTTGCAATVRIAERDNPANTTSAAGALLTAGSPLGALVRSKHSAPTQLQSTTLADYLEDAANQDGWSGGPAADLYLRPAPTGNDRLYLLP